MSGSQREPPVGNGKNATTERRIVAIVLPNLLCELAATGLRMPKGTNPHTPKRGGKERAAGGRGVGARGIRRLPPLGVVLVDRAASNRRDEEARGATEVLDAANETARRYGVRAGQSMAEARALVSRLVVRDVSVDEVGLALGRIAEAALAFGMPVGIEAPDTVWVDVTGAAHLAGGELVLAQELAGRVRSMGHVVRVAISSGPLLAQAFARWSGPRPRRKVSIEGEGEEIDPAVTVVPPKETPKRVAALPIMALPLERERVSWLMRLGVFSVGDMLRLPRAAVASRLGENAGLVLDLCEGRDSSPFARYEPPTTPFEEMTWDEPVSGLQPLLFVLRGLTSRMSARLEGRGEAARFLDLVLRYDRAVAELNGAASELRLRFDLVTPLYRVEELRRVLSSRLKKTRLLAPTVGLRLEVPVVTRALCLQLDLSRGASGWGGPEDLPVLIAELASDIGKERIGVLRIVSTHRPEAQTVLAPAFAERDARSVRKDSPRRAGRREGAADVVDAPTRVHQDAVLLESGMQPGATVSIDQQLYSVERVLFERRLDCIEWWSREPISRDYYRVWLRGAEGGVEVVTFLDRDTGARYLQAICD